jgi:cation diffusion facilitator family transporter
MGENETVIDRSRNIVAVTTISLIGLGVLQIILGEIVLKSIALTANGIDCIGDGFVSGIVWAGLKIFRKPADHRFHYGYYKIENLASIGAAIFMLFLAAYIVLRSYSQFIDPQPVQLPLLGEIVALIAAVIALGLGGYKMYANRGSRMSSVRLEAFNTIKDGTASFLTVIALFLTSLGFYVADAVVGFIIAGIIVSIGFAAIKEAGYMLVDACDGQFIEQGQVLKKIAEGIEGVEVAHLVRLRRSGPVMQGEIEIQVDSEMKISELDRIRTEINQLARQRFPEIERLTVTAIPKKK